MITIRLSRTGKRKQPYYRIVVQDSHKDPWSPAIEVLGNLNPRLERKDTTLNIERTKYWLEKGAQPSDTVNNLFIELGLIKGEKARNITIKLRKRRQKRLRPNVQETSFALQAASFVYYSCCEPADNGGGRTQKTNATDSLYGI